jgi:site-specific DNA-methyltransferase (adenine-specific)
MDEQTDECLPGFFTYSVKPNEKQHVTGKPLSLMIDILKVAGSAPAVVFDPFAGSGTTGEASLILGHKFIGCEIDTNYYQVAKNRLEQAVLSPSLFTPSNKAYTRQGQAAPEFGNFD